MDPSNTELLKQKQKLLADAVGETKDKLDTLKDAERQAEDQFKQGKISQEQYDALKREIIATEQQLEKLEDQAGKSNVALQKIGQAGEAVKEVGGKVTDVGQKMMAVTGAIAAVGTASVAAWNTVDEAYDMIAKGTGATGDALEDLQQSFDNVFSSIPTEAATAGSAIADINTRFGFTGEVLEDCTKKFIQFGEVNNTDVSTAIANVSRYMGDAGIKSSKYSEVLDQLTAASQASGLGVDKLSESLTKYGAPMRALGFDTKESIAIFAGWEKAGVNTEIAFSGMKKAIGTWGKEGKDARKEFKKTLDEIAACPDIAEATSKAIEVFGQKAGPDLADAIQGGRFAYEDFLEIVENSQGQLEQTFNDTLDPIDNVKVAMQGLTSQGAELGGALLETLAPMITALVEKIKELTTWFKGLDDSQKEMVVKIGLIAAAIGPLLIVLGQVITAVGSIMTVISGLGPVLTALSAAGGPILLTVAAVAALATIFNDAADYTSDYYLKARDLTDQEAENKTKVDELYESYDLLNQRRQDAVETVNTEAQREQTLFDELQNITDENGNVKEGYEERAAFIVGELSSALGTEISMTGNQIDKYDEMCNSIDRLIEKKQANALLAANEAAYTEAIKNQTDAFMAYNDAQKNVEDTKKSLSNAQRWEEEYQARINALLEKNIRTGEDVSYQTQELAEKMYACGEEAKGYEEKLAGQEQTLKNAEQAFIGYNTTIANYEGLSSAIISGDQQKISDAVLMAANSFQTAETSTKESLERQLQEFTQKYQEMQDAVNAGAPGVTQAQVDNMKTLVEMSQKELGELPGTVEKPVLDMINVLDAKKAQLGEAGKATGKDYTAGTAGGILEGTGDVVNAAGDMAEAGLNATREALDSHSPSRVTHGIGLDFDTGFAGGVQEGTTKVTEAVTSVTTAATGALSAGLKTSQTTTQTYQTTMSSSWTTWAAGLVSQIKTTLAEISSATDSNMSAVNTTIDTKTRSVSQIWAQRWKEIQDKHRETVEGIQELHEKTLSDMEELTRQKTDAMKEGSIQSMQELNRGVKQELDALPGIVEEGFAPAISYITSLADKSVGWGDDMMAGYIRGMRRKMRDLERACEEAADIVSDYLHHTTPEKGPMKDDDTWMPDMIQGFAKGIRDNRNLLLDQMKALTRDMALTMPNVGMMAKQPVTLKNYNVLALDGKVIADNINEQLGILL